MSEIIGCKGVCEKCEVAEICPMKGEFDQAFEKNFPGPQLAANFSLKDTGR